jgi:hypothetical protein
MKLRTVAAAMTALALGSTVITGTVGAARAAAQEHTEGALTSAASPGTVDIEEALTAQGATRIRVHESQAAPITAARGLPTDTFKVWTTWADYYKNGKLHIAFYGRWAYKSGFIGSGDPDDASAMAVTGFPSKCWTKVSAGVTTNNELGERTSLSYQKLDGHAKSIWGVKDDTRAFQLENKYGFHWIDMRRDRVLRACRARKAGSYFMEHNQGGTGGWGASVNLLILSVSYSGGGGQVLQKAATYDYYS